MRSRWSCSLVWLGTACAPSEPADLVRRAIGPEGGVIQSHDGVLTLTLLPGALTHTVDVEVFPSDEPPAIFGPAYRVRPNLDLAVDAEIDYQRVFPHDASQVSVAAIRLDDYAVKMGYWRPLQSISIDVDRERIIAVDRVLSLYYGMLDGAAGSVDPTGTGPGTSTGTGGSSGPDPEATSGSSSDGESSDTGPDMCTSICFMAEDLEMGPGPRDVAVGDFDGDGTLDVATADGGADTITVRRGDGAGGFAAAETLVVGNGPTAIGTADLDNDGDDDLVVTAADDDAVTLVAGIEGVLAVQPPNPVGGAPNDVAFGFFDEDDRLDVVVSDGGSGELTTLVTTPGGLVATGSVPTAFAGPVAVVSASFNDAGGADLDSDAFAFAGGDYHGFDGSGFGTLNAGGVQGSVGTDLGRACAGDLAGDDASDIAVVDGGRDGVWVLLGDGTATFTARPLLSVGAGPVDIASADLDGDGAPDLVVANRGDATASVLLRRGDQAWAEAEAFAVGSQPSGIATGDLDGDGAIDIVVATEDADGVTILWSQR